LFGHRICCLCPYYFFAVAVGSFNAAPVVHFHGILFFAWTLLFVAQTTFVTTGRIENHRALGLVGISLATAMLFTGFMVAANTLTHWIGTEHEAAARVAAIVPITAILTFVTLFASAVANISRPEWHKRLMLMATISLLPPAFARVLFVLFAPPGAGPRPGLTPPPPEVVKLALAPGLAIDVLILMAILYDWRARGRPHPAYLLGGAFIISVQVLRIPLSATAVWHGFTNLLVGFLG